MVDKFPADRRAEQPVQLREELVFAAGQETPVEFAGRGLRDDVDLVAGVEPGRVDGVLRGGADHLAHPAELAGDAGRVPRVELDPERLRDLLQERAGGRGKL